MATWGYSKTNGPATWEKYYPIARGKGQSPVNIVTSEVAYDDSLEGTEPLEISYKPEKMIIMKNHKHSLWLTFKEDSVIQGGPLAGKYRLKSLHFHWGAVDGRGSEHTVDDRTYSAELQFTHWNCDRYGTYQEAADRPDGLAILAVLIAEGHHNCHFKQVAEHLPAVKAFGSETCVKEPFNPVSLLPGGVHDYWTYQGSETIPPLRENVTWLVFKHPVQYSHDQLAKLRGLHTTNEEILQDNFRRPMPLCERVIRKSFKPVSLSSLRRHVKGLGGAVAARRDSTHSDNSTKQSPSTPKKSTTPTKPHSDGKGFKKKQDSASKK